MFYSLQMSKHNLDLFDLDDLSRKRIKIEDFETTEDQEEEVNSEIPLDSNPWNVTNFDAFLVYDCPECNYKNNDCVTFAKHAAMRHYNKAHDFLQRMIQAGIVNLNLPQRNEPTILQSEQIKEPIVENPDDLLPDPLAYDPEENFEDSESFSDETQCHSSVILKEDPELPSQVNEELLPLKLEQGEQIDSDETLVQSHSNCVPLDQLPNPIENYIPKKPLSGREMFAILTSPDIQASAVRSIPCGFKQDVYFVTLNFNKDKWETNQPFNHPTDDIGAVSSSTKLYLYRFVPEEMDVKFVNRLSKYKGPPLDPDTKVIMKIVNSVKQSNKNYKRNIAYIVEAPALVKQALDYCLVEYLGYDSEGGVNKEVHRNRKHGNVPYHKNDPQIMEGCKNDVRKNIPIGEVFNKWFDPSDPMMSIKSARQISDMKRNTKRTKKSSKT